VLRPTAAMLLGHGFLVVLVPPDVRGVRLVLARRWHALSRRALSARGLDGLRPCRRELHAVLTPGLPVPPVRVHGPRGVSKPGGERNCQCAEESRVTIRVHMKRIAETPAKTVNCIGELNRQWIRAGNDLADSAPQSGRQSPEVYPKSLSGRSRDLARQATYLNASCPRPSSDGFCQVWP
jgi:hypothetical protein